MERRSIGTFFVSLLLLFSLYNLYAVQHIGHSEQVTFEEKNISFSEVVEEPLGWANSAAGFGSDIAYDIHVDRDGFTYVAGSYTDWMGFNEQVDGISSQGSLGDVDMFLGKIDRNGIWQNASTDGSSNGKDTIEAIDAFENGDLLLAGSYCLGTAGLSCNLTLQGLPALEKISNSDEGNIFVGRYSLTGSWVWVQNIGNQYPVKVIGAGVNSVQNSVISFTHSGDVPINEQIINSTTDYSLTVMELDSIGNYSSHATLDSDTGFEEQGDLCTGLNQESYLIFGFSGSVLSDQPVVSEGWSDVGVAKFTSGSFEWVTSGGSTESDFANACSFTPLGKLAVGSTIAGDADFGLIEVSNISNRALFISILDVSGNFIDSAYLDSVGYEMLADLSFDVQGGLTVLGSISSSITVGNDTLIDLDSSSGVFSNDIFLGYLSPTFDWEWAINAGGEGNDVAQSLATGPDGSWIIAYTFDDEVTMSGHDSIHQGSEDVGIWRYDTDLDGDGVLDGVDVCPRIPNPDQSNLDRDAYGDLCDEDDDGDRIPDIDDDCPLGETGWVSLQSTDHDSDGCRDAGEDLDDDEDRIFDHNDACPLGPVGWISTPEEDREGDGCADYDTDEDGFVDQADNCPNLPNPTQTDLDRDGRGDPCDNDQDGDTINSSMDNCPMDFEAWISTNVTDHDRDGCRDSTNDLDDDGDGVLDGFDSCPVGLIGWSSSNLTDLDSDGCNDIEDTDDDNDGYTDDVDNCPRGIVGQSPIGQDRDNDGCIDTVEDIDNDQDGVNNTDDDCPRTTIGSEPITANGCSWDQLDDDGDGISNPDDLCPATSVGVQVALNGCEIERQTTETESNSSSNSSIYVGAILLGIIAGAIVFKLRSDSEANLEKTIAKIDSEEE